LTPQGHLALVIRKTALFRPALFSSRGVRFLMRRSHVIYTQKIPRKKLQRRKRPYRRSSSFDKHKVTARGSAGYPRVRHSAQKSPKGAAGLAQQVRKIEVFFKRLHNSPAPTLTPAGKANNSRLPALSTRRRPPYTSLTLRFATALRHLHPALRPRTSASITRGEVSAAATSNAAK
jgi:hypothetical protein